jgi:hypothetical protein
MKKNLFTKTLAVLSTVAILGVATAIGASAEKPKEALNLSNTTVKAGETATVDFTIAGNPGITGVTVLLTYDNDLGEPTIGSGSLLGTVSPLVDDDEKRIAITAYNAADKTASTDATIATLTFDIPENAEVGKEYTITLTTISKISNAGTGENFTDLFSTSEGNVGTITVIDNSGNNGGTTPPAPPATTPATEDVAPKTGASTKGIAATSAVLLAAACSAVALKKKRD